MSELCRFKSDILNIYAYLLRFDSRSHLLTHTIIGPLCTMPACYWSNYFSFTTFSKYENKAKTNPGKDGSGKNGTYGHPNLWQSSFFVVCRGTVLLYYWTFNSWSIDSSCFIMALQFFSNAKTQKPIL